MREPAIIGFGRSLVPNYEEVELLAAIHRAFAERHADFIVLDDFPHNQRFLSASCALALDRGIIYCAEVFDEGQTIISKFRLTPFGQVWCREYEAEKLKESSE